jgi:small conductance mechanosensitive channel
MEEESSVSNAVAEKAAESASIVQGFIDATVGFIQSNWLNLVAAILIFLIGKWIAGGVTGLMKKGMGKRQVDPALISFLGSLVYYGLMVAVVIAAIQQIGIETTSFVAILGAAGLAVGFALQGSLSNFAAGTLIILFKPFRIGDFIEAGGTMGIVEDIGVLATILKTPDNKKIIAPNSAIMGGVITNFSANPTRRVDMVFGISYSDDIDKAKSLILDEIQKRSDILEDPAPTVEVVELGDSSVNLCCRPWVNKADYWSVFFGLNADIKKRFDAEGITIPFPQRDVHLFQEK